MVTLPINRVCVMRGIFLTIMVTPFPVLSVARGLILKAQVLLTVG